MLDISVGKQTAVTRSRSLFDLVWLVATDGIGGFCGSEMDAVSGCMGFWLSIEVS